VLNFCPLPLAVPVQTVNEAAYRIREFRLRFFASDTMWQPPQEVRLCCYRQPRLWHAMHSTMIMNRTMPW